MKAILIIVALSLSIGILDYHVGEVLYSGDRYPIFLYIPCMMAGAFVACVFVVALTSSLNKVIRLSLSIVLLAGYLATVRFHVLSVVWTQRITPPLNKEQVSALKHHMIFFHYDYDTSVIRAPMRKKDELQRLLLSLSNCTAVVGTDHPLKGTNGF